MEKIKKLLFGKNVKFLGIGATVLIILFVIIKTTFINNKQLDDAIKKTVSNDDVKLTLMMYGVTFNSSVFADPEYNLLSKDWVETNAQMDFLQFLRDLGLTEWKQNVGDCDDFAKAFTVFLKSYIKKEHPNAASPAVGEIYYIRDEGGAHAINVIVLDDPSGLYSLSFFEPQAQKFVNLSQEEIKSIYFLSI